MKRCTMNWSAVPNGAGSAGFMTIRSRIIVRCEIGSSWSRPVSLHALNNRLVGLGQELSVTHGRKLRTDGTVIETNIQYPTDSRLLADSARVLGRLCAEARELLRPRPFRREATLSQSLAAGPAAGSADCSAPARDQGKKSLKFKHLNCIGSWSGWSKPCWAKSTRSGVSCESIRASGRWP